MSDLWIAALAGVLALLLSAADRRAPLLLIGTFGALMAGHQAYVEFFRHQIMPFHMRYLVDPQFLLANGSASLNLRSLMMILATALSIRWVARAPARPSRAPILTWVAMLAIATGLHAINIRFRVNWFIPEKLQLNFVEKFFLDLRVARVPPLLTRGQAVELSRALGRPALDETMTQDSLEAALLYRTGEDLSANQKILRDTFMERVKRGARPVILVVLLETMRASETGFLNPTSALPSLTPNLDALAYAGISFRNAYSTGTVTRSAQEASWCGYISGPENSVMRGRQDVDLDCLSRLAARGFGSDMQPHTFWLHGGDGRFDGQREFWAQQGVSDIVTLTDFGAEVPRTGWGVGDLAFMRDSASRLESMRRNKSTSWSLGMVLSVTNHTPWHLPADASESVKDFARDAEHPAFATTMYADAALQEFVTAISAAGLWNDVLLIITGDHGNLERRYQKTDDAGEIAAGRMLSHVPLILSGGIGEEVASLLTPEERVREEFVSLAQIAPLIAETVGLEARFLAPSLLNGREPGNGRPPVYADLSHALFLPQSAEKLERARLMGEQELDEMPETQRVAALHFRALSHLLNLWGLSRTEH